MKDPMNTTRKAVWEAVKTSEVCGTYEGADNFTSLNRFFAALAAAELDYTIESADYEAGVRKVYRCIAECGLRFNVMASATGTIADPFETYEVYVNVG